MGQLCLMPAIPERVAGGGVSCAFTPQFSYSANVCGGSIWARCSARGWDSAWSRAERIPDLGGTRVTQSTRHMRAMSPAVTCCGGKENSEQEVAGSLARSQEGI